MEDQLLKFISLVADDCKRRQKCKCEASKDHVVDQQSGIRYERYHEDALERCSKYRADIPGNVHPFVKIYFRFY